MDYIDENGDHIRVFTIVPGWLIRWILRPTFKRKKPVVPFSREGTKKKMRPENLICEIKFGSHLYGTNTEQSDHDFKGIFLPSKEDVLLGRIPRAYHPNQDDSRKNEPGELDCEYMSLHHFLHLAMQGQTMAIDMLFAPENMVYLDPKYGYIWKLICQQRQKLLSKNMNAFIGYCRSQANKYSLKGERLNTLTTVRDIVKNAKNAAGYPLTHDVEFGWLSGLILPYVTEKRFNPQGVEEYCIGGKWYGLSTPIVHVLSSMENSINKYGTRTHAAGEAGGVDWKALSHAVRVSKELIEILCFGTLTFPLVDAPLILRIKKGEVPMHEVQGILDSDLAFIELKSSQSILPDRVDQEYWNHVLFTIMDDYVCSGGNITA